MAALLRSYPRGLSLPRQYKPTGMPRINWGHPLAQGLISYTFDTGVGFYRQLVPGFGQFVSGNPFPFEMVNIGGSTAQGFASNSQGVPTIVTPFGAAANWQGTQNYNDKFYGAYCPVDNDNGGTDLSVIQKASMLSNLPAGAGLTFAAGCMLTDDSQMDASDGLIFGRPFNPDASLPGNMLSWGFVQHQGSFEVEAWYLTGSYSGSYSTLACNKIGNSTTVAKNSYVSLMCSMTNASTTGAYNASTGGVFYVNGAVSGSPASGLNCPTGGQNALFATLGLQKNECQIMHGGIWHIGAIHSAWNYMQGASYWGAVWNRPLSAFDAAYLNEYPYRLLIPSDRDFMSMYQVPGAANLIAQCVW